MKLLGFMTAAVLAAFTASPLAAEDCAPVDVQNLTSRAQAKIVLLETSDTTDQGMRDKLRTIRADFDEANAEFSQAMEVGDRNKIVELCPVFDDIDNQLDALKN